jgi:hypothetical protein
MHLEGSRFCFESITGKRQRTALHVLSPRLLNRVSTSHSGHSSAAMQSGVSPEKLFDYTPATDNDDYGTIYESSNDQDAEDPNREEIADKHDIDELHDQDAEDPNREEIGADKHDIDHVHELKEDTSFPSSVDDVVHLELATMCRDSNIPMKMYDQFLRWGQRAHLRGYRFPLNAPRHVTFLTNSQPVLRWMNSKQSPLRFYLMEVEPFLFRFLTSLPCFAVC